MTAGGKNVAPAVLEDRLRAHALVDQCLVVGDGQPFIGALVTIDRETFPAWAEQHGKSGDVADLVDDPDLVAAVQEAVDDANKAVSKAESIRKFTILPDEWTEEGGQLTPSLKLKRNVVVRDRAGRDRGALPRLTPSTARPTGERAQPGSRPCPTSHFGWCAGHFRVVCAV